MKLENDYIAVREANVKWAQITVKEQSVLPCPLKNVAFYIG